MSEKNVVSVKLHPIVMKYLEEYAEANNGTPEEIMRRAFVKSYGQNVLNYIYMTEKPKRRYEEVAKDAEKFLGPCPLFWDF